MLLGLSIRDFVIVEALDLEFPPVSPRSPAKPVRANPF